jgi:F-type H+-transporting ATPase subunit b
VSSIVEQLGLDESLFIQLGIFAALFLILSQVYFKPFLKLFENRHARTVADREAAEKRILEAQSKLAEYTSRLAQERATARREYEQLIQLAKAEETRLLTAARDEAKRITQQTAATLAQQQETVKRALELEVETLARAISEKLLARKV